MDYEKKYKEALERAKEFYILCKKCGAKDTIDFLEDNFPELCESEGERIRKILINYFHGFLDGYEDTYKVGGCVKWEGLDVKDVITWLEKQGEQKHFEMKSAEESLGIDSETYNKVVDECIYGEQTSVDKVEPKFKVGDYVVGKYISGYISEVRDDCYLLDYQGFPIDKQDNYHLWTIEDAKDGDVLHCWIDGYEFILIFNCIKDGYVNAFCHLYNNLDSFSEEPTTMFCRTIQGHFTPATKEQCDLLFQKMKEAGYEWDAEKKELKKISQEYPLTSDECINLAWSEEDENLFRCAIDAVKQESKVRTDGCLDEEVGEMVIHWLKSLKERYTWKPSDEQMKALHDINLTGNISYAGQGQELINLYNELKKLKEE